MQPENRVLRFTLIAIPVLLLLTVVAIAAQAGFGGAHSASPNNDYVSYAMSVFFILFVAMIPVALYSYFNRLRDVTSQRVTPGRRAMKTLLAVAVIGVLFYIRHWIKTHYSLHHIPFFGHSGHATPKHAHGKGGPGQTAQPHFEWPVLWASLLLGVALLGAWLYQRAKRPPAEPWSLPPLEEDVLATIDVAIDEIEREPDPRRAVIAAYARMERVLGRHGLQRKQSETALEYMRRVLLDVTSSGSAVERLTSLFEHAKFSSHDVTGEMKTDAIAALREIRDGITT